MNDDFLSNGSNDGWMKLGVAAELSRAYNRDGRDFFQGLVLMLQNALPHETTVEMRGGWFAKKVPQRVVVNLGEDRLSLESPENGALRATQTHVVRGIALKTEEMSTEKWLQLLGAILEERAQSSQAARDALEKMVW